MQIVSQWSIITCIHVSNLIDLNFQLMDTNAQLWYIIREYILNAEERDVDPADLISFLLELSFHVTGQV
jgi:hypothetical protein